IVMLADTGERYRFGRVVLNGNRGIPAAAIVRPSGIERGDLYKTSALQLAQQHVYNLRAFAGVRVGHEPLPGADAIAAVRVNVPVSERESGAFSGAAGQKTSLLRDSCEVACLLTYPEIRYIWDDRDSVLEPTRGTFFTIDLQQSVKPGSFTYTKIEPEARAY